MLLGAEKKRKQEEEVESSVDLRSQLSHLEHTGMFLFYLFSVFFFKKKFLVLNIFLFENRLEIVDIFF